MVILKNSFLIDSTFIFKNTHESLLGIQLLTSQGKDNTFLFVFLRDFLRIRQMFGINNCLLVVSKQTYSTTSKENIDNVIIMLNKLNIPCIDDAKKNILELGPVLCPQATHYISHDKRLLQLIEGDQLFLLASDPKDYERINEYNIVAKIGVNKENVGTLLSLTQKSNAEIPLTKNQAVRLIELYGNIDRIYENLDNIASSVKKKLSKNREKILKTYESFKVIPSKEPPNYLIKNTALNIVSEKSKEILENYGFFSLKRQLKPVTEINLTVDVKKQESNNYKPVTTHSSLNALVDNVVNAEFCAVDTETDDKDPHSATLLGVSFSFTPNEAFFVPLIESDLTNISLVHVLSALEKIFNSDTKFIGQNLKYDYLLLRRNGIIIKSIYFDTMLASFDLYGDLDFFNLSSLSKKLLNIEIQSYKDIVKKDQTFLELPFKKMVQHGCQDADITLRLFLILNPKLAEQNIIDQYAKNTVSMVKKLGELEYHGIQVNTEKIQKIYTELLGKIIKIKSSIHDKFDKKFDLDSQKELSVIIKNELNLDHYVGSKKITLALLEQLAVNNSIVKLIVKYKRFRSQLKQVELIIKSIKEGRVHPVFNQIKTSYGQLSSQKPNIFVEITGLKKCFDQSIKHFFKDKYRALDVLEQLTEDHFFAYSGSS